MSAERIFVEPELLHLGYRPMSRTHSEPKYKVPPKRKQRQRTDEQAARIAAQRKAAKLRERQRWLLLGIVKPKDDAERAWLAERQKEAA